MQCLHDTVSNTQMTRGAFDLQPSHPASCLNILKRGHVSGWMRQINNYSVLKSFTDISLPLQDSIPQCVHPHLFSSSTLSRSVFLYLPFHILSVRPISPPVFPHRLFQPTTPHLSHPHSLCPFILNHCLNKAKKQLQQKVNKNRYHTASQYD